jgi:hypothetical protein
MITSDPHTPAAEGAGMCWLIETVISTSFEDEY